VPIAQPDGAAVAIATPPAVVAHQLVDHPRRDAAVLQPGGVGVAQVVEAAQVEVRKLCRTGSPRFRTHPFAEAMASVLSAPAASGRGRRSPVGAESLAKYMTAVLVVGCGSVARTGASDPLRRRCSRRHAGGGVWASPAWLRRLPP
jgi:hypothetical protein